MNIRDFKPLLIQLSENLIPINDWLNSKSFDPQKSSWWADIDVSIHSLLLPWRDSSTKPLFHSLIVEDFFHFVNSTSQQEITIVELSPLENNPLGKCPIENVETWRTMKGLEANPSFASAGTFNLPVDSSGTCLVREKFYEGVLPVFQKVLEDELSDAVPYSKLIDDLWDDKVSSWSSDAIRSSVFLRQFLTDLIVISFRSNNIKEHVNFMLWRRLIPIECGEHRRSGNKFSEAQIQLAVTQLQELISSHLET